MNVVVVGGSGFLGGAVVRELVARGDDVVNVDVAEPKRWAGSVRDIDAPTVVADVTDRESLQAAFGGADEVYHFAGVLGTSELERDVRRAVEVNILGSLNVFDAALTAGAGTVFLACKPNVWLNAYSITKDAAEQFARIYERDHDVQIRCLRYFNAYGPRQSLVPVRKLVPTFAAFALRGLPLPVFGDGEQTVDLLFVDDLARMTVDFVRTEHAKEETLDCGSGEAVTVNEVAALVNAILDNRAGIEWHPMRQGEALRTDLVANVGPLESVLGRLDLTEMEGALAATLEWYGRRDPEELDAAVARYCPADLAAAR